MFALILAALLSTALAARPGFISTGSLEWRDCGVTADKWITFSTFDITPTPIKVPGDMVVEMDSHLTHELKNSVDMDVVIEKELLGVFTKVTCVNDVGTCHYDDPCHFLNTFKGASGCPKQLSDNGLPCTCPFNPTQIKLPPSKFTVSKVGANWAFLATGLYHIKVSVTEKANHKLRGCIETYFKMEH